MNRDTLALAGVLGYPALRDIDAGRDAWELFLAIATPDEIQAAHDELEMRTP